MLDLNVAAENAAKDVQHATENLHAQHAAKIEELSRIHAREFEAIGSRLAEAESQREQLLEKSIKDLENARNVGTSQSSDDAIEKPEDKEKPYRDALKVLEDQLALEKSSGSEIASQLEELRTEISGLTSQLDQEKSRSAKHLDDAQAQLQRMTQEKTDLTTSKNDEIAKLQDESAQMQIFHNNALESARQEVSHQIKQLEVELEGSVSQVHELENEAKTISGRHNDALQEKEVEVSSLSKVVDTLQDHIQQLQASKDHDLDACKVELIQEHEAVISKMQARHELDIHGIQESTRQESVSETIRYEDEIRNLREKMEKSRIDQESKSVELLSLKHEKDELSCSLNIERESSRDMIQELETTLKATSGELVKLKEVAEAFDEKSQDKSSQHELSLTKMRDQLESAEKALENRSDEYSSISKKQSMQLKEMHDSHAKEIATVKADIKEEHDHAFRELQTKYDNLLKTWREGAESHSIALEMSKVEKEKFLESIQKSHEIEIEALEQRLKRENSQEKHHYETRYAKAKDLAEQNHLEEIGATQHQHEKELRSHKNALSELQDQVIQGRKALACAENELQMVREAQSNTHSDEKNKYKQQFEELQDQLLQAKSDVASTQAELDNVRQQKLKAESLHRQYSADEKNMRATLDHNKETIEKLTAAVEEASNVMPDTSEAERLKESISELTKQHAVEISKIQETMSVENEKRDKERKQGAEVRDRLAAELRELESVRRELPAVKEEVEQYRKDAELARVEMHGAEERLDQALAASQDQEAHHRDALAKIDQLQAELKKARKRSATPKGHTRTDSSHAQECDALQIMVDKERQQNDKLKKQLDEALAAADRHATRAREKDAALKVTTAELTELRTKRPDGRDFTSTPTPTRKLRTSRWASNESQDDAGTDLDGENLGAHIEGTVSTSFRLTLFNTCV